MNAPVWFVSYLSQHDNKLVHKAMKKQFSQFDVEEDAEDNDQELLFTVLPLIAKKIITLETQHTTEGENQGVF